MIGAGRARSPFLVALALPKVISILFASASTMYILDPKHNPLPTELRRQLLDRAGPVAQVTALVALVLVGVFGRRAPTPSAAAWSIGTLVAPALAVAFYAGDAGTEFLSPSPVNTAGSLIS